MSFLAVPKEVSVINLLMRLAERSPALRRFLWQRWYQHLAGYRVQGWHFMNYGYEANEVAAEQPLSLDTADEPERYSIQLYDRVARGADLRGKQVLEVGSGRGGGASFVARYHHPMRMVGVDFSAKAVRFCQKEHRQKNLEFRRGDAEHLPFAEASFDAVLNVESSHCYGSMPRFVAEVKRVLKPGGFFLFADFRTPEKSKELRQLFEQSGLEICEHQDITKEVLRALQRDSARKLELLERAAPRRLLATLKRFAAVEGSDVFRFFADGTFVYERYVLKKPN